MTFWLLLAVTVALSVAITGAMRRYALAHRLLDVPNARSSHGAPTPRGGGVAIVFVVLTGLVVLWATGALSALVFTAVAGGALPVAAIGYLDDRGHVQARFRLAAHLFASAWVVLWVAPLPGLPVGGHVLPLGWPGAVLAVFAMAWLVNLYNFMDGIDGIAGVQALTAGGVLAALLWWSEASDLAAVAALVAASSAGFLWWNWPPAKIFMGDAGSGFLGFVFAALVVLAFAGGWLTLWAALIPLGVFVVDATWTLLHRLLRGERVHQAHRSHAYQRAARELGSHRPVTLAVAAINVLWLAPFACWAWWVPEHGVLALAVAWLPLLWLCVRFRAGSPD